MHPAGTDVKRIGALQKQPVVLNLGAIFKNDLGDGVGEVRGLGKAHVAFQHGYTGVGPCEQQCAGVRGCMFKLAGGGEDQVHRSGGDVTGWNINERPVTQKRGVQGREPVIVRVSVLG